MKLSQIFLFFLIISCNSQNPKNEKLTFALTDYESEIRGKVIKISSKEYRFDYYDVYENDSHFDFLISKGYQGGGPSWLGIIYGAIKMSDPEILNKIRFDEEAKGIAIWSSDKNSLEKIGRLITVLKNDETLLLKSINVAEQKGKME